MPAFFQMPFLARLTDSSTPLSLNSSSSNTSTKPATAVARPQPKKRAHESRDRDRTQPSTQEAETQNTQHVAKRPRLSTSILSSRPKIFSHGLLSPVKSYVSAPTQIEIGSSTSAPTGPGAGKAGGSTSCNNTDTGTGTTASYKQNNARNGHHGTIAIAPAADAHSTEASGATTPVINNLGFRNEVRATPDISSKRSKRLAAEDKRSLRSHDGGSRSRSELAQYFPNWDDIISNEPQPLEPLTGKTRLYITEEPPKTSSTPSRSRQIIGPPTSPTQQTPSRLGRGDARVLDSTVSRTAALSSRDPGLSPFTHVDFSAQLTLIPKNCGHDPLSDEHFRLAHQRGERQEKQLRNIEKEKAQHEKVQLERLYEGLLGHDWLRVMGISGITDTEKKSWEQKRDWVLREVKMLLDKFERYKEEEKRLRMEKEMQLEEDEDSAEITDEEIADTEDDQEIKEEKQEHRKRRRRADISKFRNDERKSTASEDADMLAAQQLQTETLSSVPKGPKIRRRKFTGIDVTPNLPNVAASAEKPFVSYFDKPHLRTAAVAGHRRGRSRFAFGLPVPEPEERDFALPAEMVTAEARRASARMRRVRRRGTKD